MPTPQIAPVVSGDFNAVFLPPAISAPIFDEARRMSVAQRLFRQVELGDNGVAIPYSATKPAASWTAEGAPKGTGSGTIGLSTITPHKLTAITVVSEEVVRKNPAGYVDTIQPDLAEAFAVAFDYAALHGLGGGGTGAGPFAANLSGTTKAVEIGTAANIYQDFVAGLALLTADGKMWTGSALDMRIEHLLLGATDSTGRPLFVDTVVDRGAIPRPFDSRQLVEGRLLSRASFMADNVGTPNGTTRVGYAGDWSKGAWGVVGGIQFRISNQAAVTLDGALVSLFENNLVAILAEAYYGFVLNDVQAFVRFTNAI